MKFIELPNKSECIEDARVAWDDKDEGPEDPKEFTPLLSDLESAKSKLPRLYRRIVLRPFLEELQDLGESEFKRILRRDRKREGDAGLLLDIAHAILQNGVGYKKAATDAFQEVVADLYDGFLSAEDRAGVKPPERGAVAPLVKWGSPGSGPYTWPVEATEEWGVGAGIVSLPPSHTWCGLTGWATLGHETAGHDILNADEGLLLELKQGLRDALEKENLGFGLPEYWSSRIDETASDVLGILNMGPAAGIGIIMYFRGYYAGKKLSTFGPKNDEHPADIVRGWLAAETVRLLSFEDHGAWADTIKAETDADVGTRTIRLAKKVIPKATAERSAEVVAKTLVKAPLKSLEGRALGDIQNWRDNDEEIVEKLRGHLRSGAGAGGYEGDEKHFAAHAVAAAVYEALRVRDADIPGIFKRMLKLLKTMHRVNPAWGRSSLARAKRFRRHFVKLRKQTPVPHGDLTARSSRT